MSLWVSVEDNAERLDGTTLHVLWHRQVGFGWYVVESWDAQRKLHQYMRADFETARALARDRCEVEAESKRVA